MSILIQNQINNSNEKIQIFLNSVKDDINNRKNAKRD
jgi:hypothetical protein